MSDVLKMVKKVFTVGVVVTTIVWSLGVAALVPGVANAATCPTLAAGDNVKVVGRPDIFAVKYNASKSRLELMGFYESFSMKSWYADSLTGGFDYKSKYISISDECYATLPGPDSQPMFVNYRPGSYLVKRQSADALYVILPGNRVTEITSQAATALYGAAAVTGAKTLSLQAFAALTAAGAKIEGAAPLAHEGMLVKKDSKTWYVDAGNVLREVTSTGMTGNRFNAAFARTLPASATATMGAGTVLSAKDVVISDASQTGGTTGPVVSGGNLTVALASDTPATTQIISDDTANQYPQAMVPFAKFNFTAGNTATKVTNLSFHRNGIASDSDLGTLYLYEGNTKLAEYTSFSNKVVTFTNSAGLFEVAAGATKTVTLKGDLARGSTSVAGSKTIGFSLDSTSDVVTNGTSGGSFPLSGNLMTTAQVTDLGYVTITATSTYPSTVKADEANKELWRMTLTAGNQDMEVRYLKFTVVGTVAYTDIKDLKLEVGGVQLGSTIQLSSAKEAVFDLSSSPLTITNGQSKILSLRGSMAGGSSRTFKFTLQRSSDLVVYDKNYNVFVTPHGSTNTTAFAIVQPTTGTGTSVDSGTLTVGVATDSPSGNIADGGNALTLAKFSFYSAGEDVKIDNLNIDCASGDGSSILKNVKLLLNGTQVGTTDTTLTCDSGTDSTTYTFGNTFIIPMATTKYLTVVADTTDTTVIAGDTLTVSLNAGSSNATGQTTLTTLSSTAQSARNLTVKSGTVSVSKNTSFSDRASGNPTGTNNSTEVKIGSFLITAGAGEAVDLTQIGLADEATSELGHYFQNLKLKNGSTQIGSTVSSLNTTAGTYTFTPSSAIRINAGQQYIVDVYADIQSSATASNAALSVVVVVDSVTATGVNTSADASYSTNVNLQAGYIVSAATLTAAIDGDTPVSGHIVMGATDVPVAKYKLTASAAEDVTITDLSVSVAVTGTVATGTLKNYKLYVDNVQVGTAVNASSSATTSYANVDFTGLSLTIPKNTNKIVTVKADVNTYDDGGVSASTFVPTLLVDKGSGVTAILAKGAYSGSSITAPASNVTANTMTAYRTKVNVAWASDSPSGAAVGGTDMVVGKIVVTNSANAGNYDATIKLMNLQLSQTGISNTATRYMKIYKDSAITANLLATSMFTATGADAAPAINFTNTTMIDGDFTDVNISANTSKTFIITLDTNDAGSTDSLAVKLGAANLTWYDGVSSVTEVPENLPLTAKTLTY